MPIQPALTRKWPANGSVEACSSIAMVNSDVIDMRGVPTSADKPAFGHCGSASGRLMPLRAAEVSERLAVLRVPVQDNVSLTVEDPIDPVRELSCHLQHPRSVWMRRDAGDGDPPSRQFHDKEHVIGDQPRPTPNLHREEVGRCKSLPMR